MAKNDELDQVIISNDLSPQDIMNLATVLGQEKVLPFDPDARREFLNKEIRHNYGHSVANVFRDWWEPDYLEIVQGTAKKLDIKYSYGMSVYQIEDLIIIEVLDRAKKQIIKEKGQAAWDEIVKQAEEGLKEAVRGGIVKGDDASKLTAAAGGGWLALVLAGKLSGFALYIVANQLFFFIARSLGVSIGVTVAGPIIGKTLSFLLGPAGWLMGGFMIIYGLGDTSWKKVIPAVVMIAILRKQIMYAPQIPQSTGG